LRELKTKYKGGRKRLTFLGKKTTVAIYENELCDVKQLSCSLDNFKVEKVEIENRCSKLLEQLRKNEDEIFHLSMEHSHLIISENAIRKENKEFHSKIAKFASEKRQCISTIKDLSDNIRNLTELNETLEEKKFGVRERQHKHNSINKTVEKFITGC